MGSHELDASPGSYGIIFNSSEESAGNTCQIGRLGTMQLKQGYYCYFGSAFGPGGLKARLGHHQRPARKPHWHLDYLKSHLKLEAIWYTRDTERREHLWASILANQHGSAAPLVGFGSSDCSCATHLIYSSSAPRLQHFQQEIGKQVAQHKAIYLAVLGA